MASVRSFDFNALPAATRQRLVYALTSRDAGYAPLLSDAPGLAGQLVGRGFLVLLGLGTLAVTAVVDLGSLGGSAAWQGWPYALVYVLATAAALYGLLSAWRRVRLRRSLPFPPGRHLFPLDVVDARTRQVRLVPLAQLQDLKAVHHHTNGVYTHTLFSLAFQGGPTETFSVRGKAAAEAALQQLGRRQAEIQRASQDSDWNTLARLDPLFELRHANWQVGPAAPEGEPGTARALAGFWRWRAVLALAGGLLFGLPVWLGRNLVSDQLQYAEASRLKTEQAYRRYLAGGRLHAGEVRAALPRVAFGEARKQGSVTALRGVLSRYPRAGLEADVAGEVHALYAAALTRFQAQASTSDPSLLPFMRRLLVALESAGSPALQVRFTRPSPQALAALDLSVQQGASRHEGREVAPATRHFGSESAASREARIVAELERGFKAIFPSDVLHVAAPRVVDARQPVIDIAYEIAPSGSLYSSRETGRLFVGILVRFDVGLALPAQPPGWRFGLDVQPPQTFSVQVDLPPGALKGVAPDERVYVVMAERAFDQLGAKLRSAFFRPGSEAFTRAAAGGQR